MVARDIDAMDALIIIRCAELHVDHIAANGDPFERGSSRPLDFGHWSAHKLEQMTRYTVRHGEAVAVGVALDTTYSYPRRSASERSEWEKILALLSAVGLPCLPLPELRHPALLHGLDEFREHLGGPLTMTLLQRAIGDGMEVHEMDEAGNSSRGNRPLGKGPWSNQGESNDGKASLAGPMTGRAISR
ncbi:MAG: hypothetical protein MPW14_24560 [Candidatus Manganitrophus sp.]|nr:MAG: hypothetical protein MPW14_24560 [Candidatus Manganitrophus sp.]